MRKIISWMLVLIIILSFMPMGLFTITAEAATQGDYTYSVSDGTATITDYNGAGGELVIPATIGGYSVTSIGRYAFSFCDSLTSVTIPDSVKSIGDSAFYSCGLISVTIPDSVISIEYCAFSNCPNLISVTIGNGVESMGSYVFSSCDSLTSVTICNGVTCIGEYAFEDCNSLAGVTIPDSVTSIGYFAFSSCDSLTSVTIPDSVTSIGEYAFSDCSNLTGIIVDSGNEYYSSDKTGVLFNKAKTTLIQYPDGNLATAYTIPNSVTSIGNSAFSSCDILTSVTIPNSVTSIGSNAFYNCSNFVSVTIPNSVTSIGSNAFYNCDSLTSVTIGNGVESMGSYVFSSCDSLTSVTIPNSVTSIEECAFSDCSNLTGIIVDSGNEYYSSDKTGVLFNKAKTTLIQYPDGNLATAYTIPNSVTSIGNSAFSSCDILTSVTIPNSVTSIGSNAFSSCSSLTNVIIGSGVTSIGVAVFAFCDSLTSVTIPNSVTSIEMFAFEDCSSLTSIIIPNSVTSIGWYAFSKCDSLTNIWYCGTESQRNSIAIDNGNLKLTDAIWHYSAHAYSNGWDTTCNVCSASRTVSLSNTAPTSFKASLVGNDDVKLTWKAGKGATHYYVYYRRAGKTDWKRADITTALNYTIKNLTDNAKYEFKVVSYLKDSSGTYKGAGTSLLTFSTTRNLSAPSKVTAKLYGHDDVQVSWSKVSNAVAYKVYYKRSTASSYTYLGTYTGTSAKKANLTDNAKYTFKVVPCTKVNGSYFEDDSSKTVSVSTTRNLSATKKVTLKLYGYDDVKVSWSKVSNAAGYKVYYKRSAAKSYSYIGFTTGTSIKKANLSDGVKYTFKVVPCTKVNGSYFEDDSTKTASITTLKKVSTPKVTKSTSTKVKVSWTDISGESGYQIAKTSDKAGKKIVSTTTTTGKSKVITAKKGVTYYYKVRAYKTVDGKKIYAPWSAVKSYKLK